MDVDSIENAKICKVKVVDEDGNETIDSVVINVSMDFIKTNCDSLSANFTATMFKNELIAINTRAKYMCRSVDGIDWTRTDGVDLEGSGCTYQITSVRDSLYCVGNLQYPKKIHVSANGFAWNEFVDLDSTKFLHGVSGFHALESIGNRIFILGGTVNVMGFNHMMDTLNYTSIGAQNGQCWSFMKLSGYNHIDFSSTVCNDTLWVNKNRYGYSFIKKITHDNTGWHIDSVGQHSNTDPVAFDFVKIKNSLYSIYSNRMYCSSDFINWKKIKSNVEWSEAGCIEVFVIENNLIVLSDIGVFYYPVENL